MEVQKMTQQFVDKIIREGIVDTKNYRYITKECGDHLEIRRLPIEKLDTTAALSEWETVKIIK
jgi:hypothetical protein